jgi:hypothetical protein
MGSSFCRFLLQIKPMLTYWDISSPISSCLFQSNTSLSHLPLHAFKSNMPFFQPNADVSGFISFGNISCSGIAGWSGTCISSFLKNLHIFSHNGYSNYIPTKAAWGSLFSALYLDYNHSNWVDLQYPDDYWCWDLSPFFPFLLSVIKTQKLFKSIWNNDHLNSVDHPNSIQNVTYKCHFPLKITKAAWENVLSGEENEVDPSCETWNQRDH